MCQSVGIARQAMPTTFEKVNNILLGIRPIAGRPCIATLVIHTCMQEIVIKHVHDVSDLSLITCESYYIGYEVHGRTPLHCHIGDPCIHA